MAEDLRFSSMRFISPPQHPNGTGTNPITEHSGLLPQGKESTLRIVGAISQRSLFFIIVLYI
jgi:hypothetical protein